MLGLTVLPERVPEQMLGRVLGLSFATATGADPPRRTARRRFLIAGVGVRGEMALIASSFGAIIIITLLHPIVPHPSPEPSESEHLPVDERRVQSTHA